MISFGQQGTLTKMLIRAFQDEECRPDQEVTDLRFEVLLNPETISLNYAVLTAQNQAPNNSGANKPYVMIAPERVDFEFLFDRTGAVPGAPPQLKGIQDDIEKLKKILKGYDPEKHKTYNLVISWGTYVHHVKMRELQINFKLFRPDGVPIRATARCTFEDFVASKLREAKENKQSPDVTHVRTATGGEHLPYMTHKIYGDSKHYLEVARANNIVHFRRIRAGQNLIFPPIDK